MANREQLVILEEGVGAWNNWRRAHGGLRPDLRMADLSSAMLAGADLSETDLSGADLHAADLRRAILIDANLSGANLRQTSFREAIFFRSILSTDVVTYVDQNTVDYTQTEPGSNAFDQTDMTNSRMSYAILVNVDLSTVVGLATVKHSGPSYIGIDTVYRSGGRIPAVFLRGAGVPEGFIRYIASQVGKLLRYYSCFISYSSKDHEFAVLLHKRLQNEGVRVWLAGEDMRIGEEIRSTIYRTIGAYDKLLVIISGNSLESEWVKDEVETALERERQQKRLTLFPIRLDDTVWKTEQAWAKKVRQQRSIGDFTRWKDPDAYQEALDRLLHDLQVPETASE